MSETEPPTGPDAGSRQSIARVRVDLSVQHLDRDFDYLIPPDAPEGSAVPGARVRVRFSGRLRDAYVIARTDDPDVSSPKPFERVIDAIPPLTEETLALVEETAKRYVGSFWDVARAAVPARHARAEKSVLATAMPDPPDVPARDPGVWRDYAWPEEPQAPEAPQAPRRLVWSSAPASDFAAEIVDLAIRTRSRGAGALIVLPDAADVERVRAPLVAALGKDDVAVLAADQGPERRYREFLRVRTGRARTAIGTRNAVFAPVEDLGAVIVWDDGDDVYREPHAPYWDAREVAALRSHLSDCDLFVGGPARSVATEWWCRSGWARAIEPQRPAWWQVQAIDDSQVARDPAAQHARIPSAAWDIAHDALAEGPVLFQVLRRGYVPILACQGCRAPAVCANPECGGALQATSGHAVPSCTRCGALAGSWSCPTCRDSRLRAVTVGAGRTAEELGRAFPGVPIVWSEAERIVRAVDARPAVVVATPGAEPVAEGGYRAVVLLDARVAPSTLSGPEQQLRRWFAASSLVGERGRVCVVADPGAAAVQALIRWDSRWFADRQIAERSAVGLPPVTRVAELTGPSAGVAGFTSAITLTHRVLGPVPVLDDSARAHVRSYLVVPRHLGSALSAELDTLVRRASIGGSGSTAMREVRVRMDPRDM